MSIISGIGNVYFVYEFIKKLITPFDKTEAYKLGIIDENGKILKKRSSLKTMDEREAYTLSDTLIFNLKKILGKLPGGKTRLATFAAALFLLKEDKNINHYRDFNYLQQDFTRFLKECENNDNEVNYIIEECEKYYEIPEMLKEEGLSAGSGFIAGLGAEHPTLPNQAEPPGPKGKVLKRRKFAGADIFVVDPETYMKARFGKKKYVRYEKYVGNDEIGEEIREYGRKNPDKPIIIQDSNSGFMCYLRYGKK